MGWLQFRLSQFAGPGRELGIVRQDGPDANQNRVHGGPQARNVAPGLQAANPEGRAGARCALPIGSHRIFQRDEREAGANPFEIGLIQMLGFSGAFTDHRLDARRLERADTPSIHPGARIDQGRVD